MVQISAGHSKEDLDFAVSCFKSKERHEHIEERLLMTETKIKTKPILFSGVQPSGAIMIGNYIGLYATLCC